MATIRRSPSDVIESTVVMNPTHETDDEAQPPASSVITESPRRTYNDDGSSSVSSSTGSTSIFPTSELDKQAAEPFNVTSPAWTVVQSPRRVYNDGGHKTVTNSTGTNSIFPPIKGDGEVFGKNSPLAPPGEMGSQRSSQMRSNTRLAEKPVGMQERCIRRLKARQKTIAGCCFCIIILGVLLGGLSSWARITGSFEALEVMNNLCDDITQVRVLGSVNNPSFMSPTVQVHGAHFALETTKQVFAAVRAPYPKVLIHSGGWSPVEVDFSIEIVDRELQGAIMSEYLGPSVFSAVQSVSWGAIPLSTLNTSFLFGERELAAEEENALDEAVKEARR
jgi:hypothetical protein